jgi:PKD repeat protein
VRLYGPDGGLDRATLGDGGAAQVSRHELDATGTYTVVATTRHAAEVTAYDTPQEARRDTFDYQLRLYEGFGDPDPTAYGEAFDGALTRTDSFQPALSGYYDAYAVPATAGDVFDVTMRPEDPESRAAQLRIHGPGGQFYATGSDRGTARVVEYEAPENGTYVVVATTRYAAGGPYDDREAAHRDRFDYRLNVSGPDNNPPIADATAPTRVAVGERVDLDASGSTDVDGDALSYEWSQETGLFDPEVTLVGADTATPTFVAPDVDDAEPLTFDVTVTDGAGGRATASVDVTVDPTLPQQDDSLPVPPRASFDYAPSSPTAGETVTFDAANATDPDGSVAAYEWDVDGDETPEATGETATHAFGSAGDHPVTLTVTDDAGLTNRTTRVVTVTAGDGDGGGSDDGDPADGTLFADPVPGTGATAPPTDPDGDGEYEDVDGSGTADFDDAVALAFADTSGLSDDQRAALDFDGDGDVDFDDAVSLAFQV